jgi:hypothetical protein
MDVFEVVDKTGRKIRLTERQWRHIQKHPHMHESVERIKETIKNPLTIRRDGFSDKVYYFYEEYKNMGQKERYLFVSIKYLNGEELCDNVILYE